MWGYNKVTDGEKYRTRGRIRVKNNCVGTERAKTDKLKRKEIKR